MKVSVKAIRIRQQDDSVILHAVVVRPIGKEIPLIVVHEDKSMYAHNSLENKIREYLPKVNSVTTTYYDALPEKQ